MEGEGEKLVGEFLRVYAEVVDGCEDAGDLLYEKISIAFSINRLRT
jgi:hypothetical protein